ncbi:hypothetical protein Pth03_57100 [Planotetraspora thailandica]|uniref:E9imm peptide n=1 Tax=Planotetraspora thailandica TaxID=487172 RepID=A0A8J3XYJ9_9ACTN|nr:bacteriocin immunity protein [Planotetraspora thailandica]GII57321.1 hypothetical protein Pth03_57100 [Planotetraspora thailandica]
MTKISSEERTELIRLVDFLMSAQGTEKEQDEALRSLESRVPHPRVSDLIFWPQHEGFDHDPTAQQVVDAALAYRPIEL